jgi:hypothetical protein
MLQALQKNWYKIKGGRSGHRFREFYRSRQMERGQGLSFAKVGAILGGIVLTGLGIVLIPVPGPGTAVTILGLALFGSEFEPVAHALDWLEEKLRPLAVKCLRFWDRFSGSAQVGIKFVGGLVCLIAAYTAYRMFP